jgi:hypothetical protein
MANDPKYVRLTARLARGIVTDLNTGFTISGLDVQPFPNPKERPLAARFVRDRLNRGVLEPASKAEYEEVQELREELQSNFNSRIKAMAQMAPVAGLAGISLHQESQIRTLAGELADRLEQRRLRSDSEDSYEADRERRKELISRGKAQDDEDDSEETEEEDLTESPVEGADDAEDDSDDSDEDDEEEEDYSQWSVADLRSELESRELPTGGNKPDLVQRLQEDDESEEDDEG